MLPGLFIYSFSLLMPFLETSAGGRGGGEGLGGHRPHFGGSGGDSVLLWEWGQGCWLGMMSLGGIWELRLGINQNFSGSLGWKQRL